MVTFNNKKSFKLISSCLGLILKEGGFRYLSWVGRTHRDNSLSHTLLSEWNSYKVIQLKVKSNNSPTETETIKEKKKYKKAAQDFQAPVSSVHTIFWGITALIAVSICPA